MTESAKEKMKTESAKQNKLNVRINPVWREAFGLAAKARWTDATGLIHQFVKAIVDIEREKSPLVFNRFGDLDSIPLQDIKDKQAVPANAPEDVMRIAYVAEIATIARNLLMQSTSGRVTVEQAGDALIRNLEAVAAKLLNEPGGLHDITAERKETERPTSQPTHTEPSRTPTSTIQSPARKRDKIDRAIDLAFGFAGKPASESDRRELRRILEEEMENSNKSP